MKKLLLFLGILVCTAFHLRAQTVELAPFGGYVFGGTMQGQYGDVYIRQNAQYGAILSIAVSPSVDVDLLYNRSDTKAEINYYTNLVDNITYEEVPLSINYMHIGFTKNFRVNKTVSPFTGFNLGACLWDPKQDYSAAWFFSMGINAGAKIYFNKVLGIRMQAQGMIPVQGSGFSMFIGSSGTGGGVSVYSTLFQFGFTGGLIFRFGSND